MKKLYFVLIALAAVNIGFAQSDSSRSNIPAPAKKKKDWSKVDIGNRPNDHFLVQIGFDGWSQKPDSIRLKGVSRSLGVYFMLDFPFKTDPRFSVGLGAGISGSSIYFDNMEAQVAGTGNKLVFKDVADTNHFKKNKLTTAYLEA
ncbi:MAG: hypothetical protein H7Y27_08985, partial [Gemmatimonadaceae bacterium]|nr:hypothetical protein [Chitinophagaceae bacterium]